MTFNFEYSVVVPVYNSYEGLTELYSKLTKTFKQINSTYEVIFVDDYSTDKSWDILQEIKQTNPDKNITIAKLSKNFGQHKATLCGIELVSGERTITIDDDLQVNPSEIIKLVTAFNENQYDIIYGSYKDKKHSKIKNAGSKIIQSQTKILIDSKFKATSFRLFKTELRNGFTFVKNKTHIFIDEILMWNTANIGAIYVEHSERKYNTTSYSNKKLFNLGINTILFTTNIPLKLMVYFGFFGSFGSFILGIRFIYRRLAFDVPLGYTSMIVTILFSTSILLLMFGIIGKYINELYLSINQKPPYLINKIIK